MPKVKKGESEADYLSRCIPELVTVERRSKEQAYIICKALYKKSKEKVI